MSRRAMDAIANRLKDGDGYYIWSQPHVDDEPTLFGAYIMVEDGDTIKYGPISKRKYKTSASCKGCGGHERHNGRCAYCGRIM